MSFPNLTSIPPETNWWTGGIDFDLPGDKNVEIKRLIKMLDQNIDLNSKLFKLKIFLIKKNANRNFG
jgi:hypothetical protein